jgi:hypothetical protein
MNCFGNDTVQRRKYVIINITIILDVSYDCEVISNAAFRKLNIIPVN